METNWSIEQTKKLFSYARAASESGKGLSWAFLKMADESGRSVNSVRNYYYSQLKMFELIPSLAGDLGIKLVAVQRGRFELFKSDEITNLVQQILAAKAGGISVRATIAELSGGDEKKGLRLQNKYRSMVTHHKQRVTAIMNDLGAKGIAHYNPYTKSVVTEKDGTDNHKKLADYIAGLNEDEVDSFFTLMRKLFA